MKKASRSKRREGQADHASVERAGKRVKTLRSQEHDGRVSQQSRRDGGMEVDTQENDDDTRLIPTRTSIDGPLNSNGLNGSVRDASTVPTSDVTVLGNEDEAHATDNTIQMVKKVAHSQQTADSTPSLSEFEPERKMENDDTAETCVRPLMAVDPIQRGVDEQGEERLHQEDIISPGKKPKLNGVVDGKNNHEPGSRPERGASTATASIANGHMTNMKPAVHNRFESEEREKLNTVPHAGIANEEKVLWHRENGDSIEANSESDDEAPETVTALAGLSHARSTVREALKATEQKQKLEKQKRRKRDVQLKEQAKLSRKHQSKRAKVETKSDEDAQMLGDDDKTPTANSLAKELLSRGGPLPALLPDEILAIEPATNPPRPLSAPQNLESTNPRKRKFADADPKPIKDIRRGAVRVRVLEDLKATLPPRSSKASQMLRERWLAGHRKGNDTGTSRRVKVGAGFVRK